jgi:sigma-54 specific flagellar transcriptional regulator A
VIVDNPSLQAVIYDCDAERAAQLGILLKQLRYQPMVMDHAALVSTVLRGGKSEQVLMIGDVADLPDWHELGVALRQSLCDVPVISYGSTYIADELAAIAGAQRITRLRFPFTAERLAQALHHPLVQTEQDTAHVTLPTGISAAIREVNRLIRQVAAHGSSVLILGESGSGKELVAHAVHDASPRRQRPFVAINCGAIPSELLESELFGHEKGAFTGAITARKGRFEIAEGGTLFLDEIGDMSMTMQVKLLRVLQERVFERVGSHAPIRCNVRIIAATHRNLEESISKGSFREDLYYRLNVFPIEMPPLRERSEDLPLLISDFIKNNAANGRAHLQLQPQALTVLAAYPWPGNVRELANLMERLSILCPTGKVGVADLPARYRPKDWCAESFEAVSDVAGILSTATDTSSHKWQLTDGDAGVLSDEHALLLMDDTNEGAVIDNLPAQGLDLRTHLYDIERTLIRQALERSGGTVAQAARLLRLRRTTLVEKLRKFELLDDRMVSEI